MRGLAGEKHQLSFGRAGFEMPVEHPSGNVAQVVCCTIWNVGEVQDPNIHWGVIHMKRGFTVETVSYHQAQDHSEKRGEPKS